MTDKQRIEALEKAIRDHRATKAPNAWSDADRSLYGILPEVMNLKAVDNANRERVR